MISCDEVQQQWLGAKWALLEPYAESCTVGLSEQIPDAFIPQLIGTQSEKVRHGLVASGDEAAGVRGNKAGISAAVKTADHRLAKLVRPFGIQYGWQGPPFSISSSGERPAAR